MVEGGCQGTMRAELALTGKRAHSARSWLGVNAIHLAAPVLQRLADYQAREVEVDGLTYREGLNAVFIDGGVAGNVVPDECTVTVNYRFAPDRTEAEAVAAPAGGVRRATSSRWSTRRRRPVPAWTGRWPSGGPAALGGQVRAKLGWTDVARFAAPRRAGAELRPGRSEPGPPGDESVEVAAWPRPSGRCWPSCGRSRPADLLGAPMTDGIADLRVTA